MPDPRVAALAGVVARVGGAACWLARWATRAAVVGGVAGLLLWWSEAGDLLTDWWRGTAWTLVLLALCLAPAAWLVNVRFALLGLVELPDKLGGVATRRLSQLRPRYQTEVVPERPDGGVLDAVRSVRGIVRDYGDVVGSWGAVAQLLVPSFWLLTVAAFVAVPIMVLLAAVAGLVDFSRN